MLHIISYFIDLLANSWEIFVLWGTLTGCPLSNFIFWSPRRDIRLYSITNIFFCSIWPKCRLNLNFTILKRWENHFLLYLVNNQQTANTWNGMFLITTATIVSMYFFFFKQLYFSMRLMTWFVILTTSGHNFFTFAWSRKKSSFLFCFVLIFVWLFVCLVFLISLCIFSCRFKYLSHFHLRMVLMKWRSTMYNVFYVTGRSAQLSEWFFFSWHFINIGRKGDFLNRSVINTVNISTIQASKVTNCQNFLDLHLEYAFCLFWNSLFCIINFLQHTNTEIKVRHIDECDENTNAMLTIKTNEIYYAHNRDLLRREEHS